MDYLDKLNKAKKAPAYEWQEKALVMWDRLGMNGKPPSSFFKCFKINAIKAEQIVLSMSDMSFDDPIMMFFKLFNK